MAKKESNGLVINSQMLRTEHTTSENFRNELRSFIREHFKENKLDSVAHVSINIFVSQLSNDVIIETNSCDFKLDESKGLEQFIK